MTRLINPNFVNLQTYIDCMNITTEFTDSDTEFLIRYYKRDEFTRMRMTF